jgi:multicomponent Na+:H+ antiporter subunit A
LAFGVRPDLLQDGLMRPAAAAVLGTPYAFGLYLWHGLTLALGLSALTVLLGVVLTAAWPRLHPALVARFAGVAWGPVAGYFALLRGLVAVAYAQTKLVQSHDLRHHLTVIVAFAVGLTGAVGVATGAFEGLVLAPVFEYAYEVVLLLVIVAGVASAVRAHTRMVAITSLGIVGFGIALIFVLFAAPDLAITQFLVETLVVIIVALVLVRLPRGTLRAPDNGRIRLVAAAIASLGGALFAGLLMAVTSYPLDRTLTEFFEAASYPEANGRNIVNVILVDFRGIDTLGEITVLAVAATGVYALLRRVRAKRADAAVADGGAIGDGAGGEGGAS